MWERKRDEPVTLPWMILSYTHNALGIHKFLSSEKEGKNNSFSEATSCQFLISVNNTPLVYNNESGGLKPVVLMLFRAIRIKKKLLDKSFKDRSLFSAVWPQPPMYEPADVHSFEQLSYRGVLANGSTVYGLICWGIWSWWSYAPDPPGTEL